MSTDVTRPRVLPGSQSGTTAARMDVRRLWTALPLDPEAQVLRAEVPRCRHGRHRGVKAGNLAVQRVRRRV